MVNTGFGISVFTTLDVGFLLEKDGLGFGYN